MRTHLLKLATFATVQAVLFAFVTHWADPPATMSTESGSFAVRSQLAHALQEKLYRAWLVEPAAVRNAVERGIRDRTLKDAFKTVRSDADGYLMSIVDKDRLLRTAEGRRLILIGGSNLTFGIDGPALKDRYGVTPVNLGLHEMLRADYMLRHTAEHVRHGDVVVFCFEFGTMLSGGEAADPELQEQLCEHLPELERYFTGPTGSDETGDADWKQYSDKLALADFAAHTRDVAQRFCSRAARTPGRLLVRGFASEETLRTQFEAEYLPVADQLCEAYHQWIRESDVYCRSGFNDYGDMTSHYGLRSDRPIQPNGVAPLNATQGAAISKSLRILNGYVAQYREKGATVLFAYPPLCEGNVEFAAQYESLIANECDAPILFPIALARTQIDEHFDSGYHLNWNGICRRMEVWMTALDRHLPPRVSTTPAEQIAARDQAIRNTVIATRPDASTRVQ